MKPPRLPEYPTIAAAASWLTAMSSETWTEESVLARFLEWSKSGTTEARLFIPETLLLLVRQGDELLDCGNGFAPIVLQHPQLFALCAPLDDFIESLMLSGAGKPPTLTNDIGSRYRCEHSVVLSDVRIHRDWLEPLLLPFDRLVLEVDKGLHSGLFVDAACISAESDARNERGCRRLILENWSAIVKLHGIGADGRQVRRLLSRTLGQEQKLPELKTIQNKLAELRKEGLIP